MLSEIYLVRHAAPDRSLAMPYNVLPGPPLTATGRQEAGQTAIWLRNRQIERLIASPFERTSATASAISDAIEVPITFADSLREGGPGEPHDKIRTRIVELLAQLDDSDVRCVALVTHGICVRSLLMHTTGDRIDLSKHVYDYNNNAPTAGVWHGQRGDNCWKWDLAFRPSVQP